MRVEEITESGIFKFITKDGSSSDFLGQLEILDGGKGKIYEKMVVNFISNDCWKCLCF